MEQIQANVKSLADLQAERRKLAGPGADAATAAVPPTHTFESMATLVATLVPGYQTAFDDLELPDELQQQRAEAGQDITSLLSMLTKMSARAAEFAADATRRGTAAAQAIATAAAAARQAAETAAAAAETAAAAEVQAAEALRTQQQQHLQPPPQAPAAPVVAATAPVADTTAANGGPAGSGAAPSRERAPRARSHTPHRECDRTAIKVAEQTNEQLQASRAARLTAKLSREAEAKQAKVRGGGSDGSDGAKVFKAAA